MLHFKNTSLQKLKLIKSSRTFIESANKLSLFQDDLLQDLTDSRLTGCVESIYKKKKSETRHQPLPPSN